MRNAVVERAHHVKDRVSRLRKVRKYERIGVACLCNFPEESTFHIRRDPYLSRLQDQGAYLPLLLELLFQLLVNHLLAIVKAERNLLALLVDDLQDVLGIHREVGFENPCRLL